MIPLGLPDSWHKVKSGVPLFLSGAFYIFFSISSIIKFYFRELFLIMPILYSLSVLVVGIGLVFSLPYYFYFAKRFSNVSGYLCGLMGALAGSGYVLISLSYLGTFLDNLLVLGIGITFVRVGLFFYALLGIFFFFERPNGAIGAYGSILILAFGASYHFFVFSHIFLSVFLGMFFSILAGIGLLLQGTGFVMISGKLWFVYPRDNAKII